MYFIMTINPGLIQFMSCISHQSQNNIKVHHIRLALILGRITQYMVLDVLLDAMGWGYSLAWSLSFYGQIIQNYKLKSVQGMNLDFAALNLNGFLFYFIYNVYGYAFKSVSIGSIQPADLLFSGHALAATAFTAFQILLYPRIRNTIRLFTIALLAGLWIIAVTGWVFIGGQRIILMLGWFKLICTMFKYIPQIWWNWTRKSTFGWSIFNVIMDLTGGILSVSQSLLRLAVDPMFSLNVVKMLLGALTIAYDSVFMCQHFIFYRADLREIPQQSTSAIQTISPPCMDQQERPNSTENQYDPNVKSV